MVRRIQKYGWKPDLPDHRDLLFHRENTVLSASQLSLKVDLSPGMPPIYDQGQLGSCTGNGWARIMEYMAMVQNHEAAITPSRLFIYFNERVIENTVSQDAGAEIRDGAKVLATLGVPPETDWPYDISQFAVRPPPQAYTDAKQDEALVYQRIVLGAPGAPMRTALAKGLPIVFGFSVPDYFESGWGPNGDCSTPLPLPKITDQIIGGHCVVITGYDFSCTKFPRPYFQIDNSWGPDWGIGGRFLMDYRWFDSSGPNAGLASDLWVVQKVS